MYGIIYKISNTENAKVYIGQTRYTLEQRFTSHKKKAMQNNISHVHLHDAMRKYGIDKFSIEQIDSADSQEELNRKEKYWISFYDSIATGYNMMDGGTDSNPMDSGEVKKKHLKAIRSEEVRNKISKTLHELRTTIGFSEEHRQKISENAKNQIYFYKNDKVTHTNKNNEKRINELLDDGWQRYDRKEHKNTTGELNSLGKIKCLATRSVSCYCIINNERHDFESYLEAGLWWYNTYKPFGDVYSAATFQRKIKLSIAGKEITFGTKGTKNYIHITNIKWYKGE